MELLYSKHRSEIVEFLMAPFYVQKDQIGESEERSQKEKEILKEALLVEQQLQSVFESMSERLSVYLFGANFSFLHYLYFELLEAGKDPATLEETCHLLATASQETVERAIRFALIAINRGENNPEADLLEMLEQTDLKAEDKWKWFQAIRKPLETVREQLALVAEVASLYRPYYESFQQQREAFAMVFSYEEIYGEDGLYKTSGVEDLGYDSLPFFVLSPWLMHFSYICNHHYHTYPIILCASVDIDKLLLIKQAIDEDVLATTLKVMSDETRYKVMVALTKPHAKSKDIAEQLSITGAAVSFHTQKLINAKLLLFNTADKTVKFDANKGLLREMIAKLEEDFDL
ncbi:ArsR family transcriptional regulator [Streptococcus sp. zg-86]|uniref:ArsR family transcriptional regulator n=1 Tax=Streptococcus zhangguiae TaxID=2664091 RepID=A0A6I4RA91_9STRE|nr:MULTISPECIES: winged helix-turn-helix transcriptional regulator [unclassified Streptococcus]MTB64442.1 ArsR family transcriptional regulator [Streptococcus sp. zg-86]MTB90868.1 ArsR family transcriptional regulator [Streptococcus sp. zg-36]MWV56429.1 ArsR family transcriptional regulator [Streptococcus sp. zg-70]QTH47364.1 winged helix-turn-helix transcriptional regulator [Streptococcus sp. zg-86]